MTATLTSSSLDFNPRPPRGGRPYNEFVNYEYDHFNPRPPRGGRPWGPFSDPLYSYYFNPRPPRGGRLRKPGISCRLSRFQSTPPARGATIGGHIINGWRCISIHAPREGGDFLAFLGVGVVHRISIHAPREGGDLLRGGVQAGLLISIHAPREGGDFSRR